MYVRYPTSIITLEKITEPMHSVRLILYVDYYTRENSRANVLLTSDIRGRSLREKKSSNRCIKFVRYSMSIITLEKIVLLKMYYVRPIFDIDYYSRENHRTNV